MGRQCRSTFKPTVGGSTTLRSYNDYRFRDRQRRLFQRRVPLGGVLRPRHGALLRLGHRGTGDRSNSSLSNLKNGYGIGFRFNTYKSVWFRVDIGFGGDDGVRYFFKFSKAF